MREIKFRGLLDVQNRWAYGNLIVDSGGNKYIAENTLFSADGHHLVYSPTDEPVFVKQETVGQYTGMIDCNGTEVYEGDIVRVDDDEELAEISWENCKFVVCQGDVMNDLGEYYSYEIEVVGNIHENKDLLDGDADV